MEHLKDLFENHLGIIVMIIIAIVAGFLKKKKIQQPVPNEEYTEFSDETDENHPFFEVINTENEEHLQQNLEIFPKNSVNDLEKHHSIKSLKESEKFQSKPEISSKAIQNKEDNEDIIDFSEDNIVQAILYSEILKRPNY